jgi:hypothetical protein
MERLASPISKELAREGWREANAQVVRARLEVLCSQIELLGGLPAMPERPLNMGRVADYWGITSGCMVEDLAALENDLRRAP